MTDVDLSQADPLLDLRDAASAVSAQLRALAHLNFADMEEGSSTFGLARLLNGLADQLDAAAA